MGKAHLLKPFPVFIHVIFWIAYFLWIGPVNIFKYGTGHVWVMIGVIPVMLGISYLNWYGLRQLFLKELGWKNVVFFVLHFLLLLFVGYQVLYGYPNAFARRVLKAPDKPAFDFVIYFIEVAGFYWTFAYKGLGLAAAEILFNLVRERFAYLKEKRRDRTEQREKIRMRRWLSHFLGNMTQSVAYSIRHGQMSATMLESYAVIGAFGIRIMAREKNFFVPLDDELYHLQRLAIIYPVDALKMEIKGDTQKVKIIPMLLLGLYKNMYKHGDFENGKEGIFSITAEVGRLIIITKNTIAARSAWMYERGGSGLLQLESIL